MTIITAEPASATEITLEVGITYSNDRDLAEDATVTAMLTGPDGAVAGPFDLPRRSGAVYATTVPVPSPGSWTVEVTSTTPTAAASTVVDLSDVAPSTTPPPTHAQTTTTTTTTTTTAPASTESRGTTSESRSATTQWLILGSGALVFGVAVGIAYWVRAKKA